MKQEELMHLPMYSYANHTLDSKLTIGDIVESAQIILEVDTEIKGFVNGERHFND